MFGGSHSCSPGAPVPSAPSSVGAISCSPPSIVVVWYHRLPGTAGLQSVCGGCTSMKYVAGPRLLISTKPSVAAALDVFQIPPQSGLLLYSTVTALPVCSSSPTWNP